MLFLLLFLFYECQAKGLLHKLVTIGCLFFCHASWMCYKAFWIKKYGGCLPVF